MSGTSSPKPPKQSSRWGSLLSGAVAGIESRLDTILAEEGAVAAKQAAAAPNGALAPQHDTEKAISRTPPARKTDPRRRPTSSRPSPQLRPQTQSPAPPYSDYRTSFESSHSEPVTSAKDEEDEPELSQGDTPKEVEPRKSGESAVFNDRFQGQQDPTQSTLSSSTGHDRPTDTIEDAEVAFDHPSTEVEDTKTKEDMLSELSQARDDYEKAELRRQEEVHEYTERIDALQAKLQYLAREVTSAAKQITSETLGDSVEKKLVEKDEKIALLMEEGTKLSKSEVSQSVTIRNLRQKITEDGKNLAEAKRRAVNAERSLTESTSDASRLEADRKDLQSKLLGLSRLERETPALKRQLTTKDARIGELLRQLEDANQRAENEQIEARKMALEEERKISQLLRDEMSEMRKEQSKREERASAEQRKVEDKMQREVDRNRASEVGLRNEVSLLENRLEAFRERSEEASAGSLGDTQANLMRQVETLQSQYALASENWQGIESSLQTRITALERERDDSSRHETEARKRVRESGINSRRLQSQIDGASHRCQILENDLTEQNAQTEKLRKRASDFEKILHSARSSFEREKQEWANSLTVRIEQEKLKWQQQHTPTSAEPSVILNSPHSNNRKISGLEFPGMNMRKSSARQPADLNLANLIRPVSRRSSALPRHNSETFSPTNGTVDSGLQTPSLNGPLNVPEAPSIHNNDQDEDFDNRSSPRRTVNDMLSASTAAAGPSVQLVERMSANVRRLESEKAASKDEMARLLAQRDEARKEIVALMQEVEQKREVDMRVSKLEGDLNQVNQRYQATLELLGEKSERVGELEADVADLKKIYKDLVDNTLK